MDQVIKEEPDLGMMEIESHKESSNQVFDSMRMNPGGLKCNQEGVEYQQALINIMTITCYSKFQTNFSVLSEEETFAKFDDLVLKFPGCLLCIQLKHQKDKKPYSVTDLMKNTDARINLADYLRSYLNIKERFGDKDLSFIFFFNSGFTEELQNCTKVISFVHDDTLFQGFKGETRIFDFEKNAKCKKIKKEFVQVLRPLLAMEIEKRKARASVEVELPNIQTNADINQFIKALSKTLQSYSSTAQNILHLGQNKDFEAFSKPLFLSLLDLNNEEMEKSEIQLNFTESFILNANLTGLSKKIRNELEFKKGEDLLKAVLRQTSVKYQKNLMKLDTVADPEAKSFSAGDFSISQIDESKTICRFLKKKDQFLLMSLFRSEKESGPLIFEHHEYESDLKEKIYKSFFNIFTKHVVQKSTQKCNFEENEKCLELIDKFLADFRFKINQSTTEELRELSYKQIKGLTEIGSREIQQAFFVKMRDWLVSPRTTRLKGGEFHKLFQETKVNLRRFELFRDTLPFGKNCQQKLSVLKFSKLDSDDPLKIFLVNPESYIFVISEDGVGRSRLDAYQAISEIDQIQKDSWAFIDIKVDHFQSLISHLKSTDLQFIIIDISIELNESKYELLGELLITASEEKKKVILLNTHRRKEIQAKNSNLICNVSQEKFSGCITAKKLECWQIENACQNYQGKYLFAGGKYRQIRDILIDKECGIYQAMSHPEYLYEILQNCENTKEDQIDSQPFYIQNEVIDSNPLYNLNTLLMQTTAKIIWLQNSPNNMLDLLERWFPNQTSKDQKEKKYKIGPYYILRDINSFQRYLELPTYKGRVIIIGYISSMVYQKIKRKILHVYCPDNQGFGDTMKKSFKRNSLLNYPVEIIEKNDFVKIIKPISFSEASQIGKVQTRAQESLLQRSIKGNRGNISWILANAGMGKTYLLNELKRRWQNIEENWSYDWVFMIDLTKIDYNKITENTILEDFLVDVSPEFDQKQAWLRTTLEYDINSGRVLLLLDAWDEVKPAMLEKIEMLIEKIPSNMNFIIVTRPYGLDAIDLSRWNHSYLTLKPFNEELVNEYIAKFFSQESFSGDYLENLSRKILEWMKNLSRNFSQVLGIPLQISQLCQVFLSKMRKGLDLDISEWFDENKPLNITRLYDQFIETVFCKIHQINPEGLYSLWKSYFDYLSTQAYQQLFDKSQRYIDDYHSLDQLPNSAIELLLKTGLVKPLNLNDGKIEFAHQTYKEYFGAFYLLRILCGKKDSDLYKEVEKDINDNKYTEYYQMVFSFAFQISFHGHPLLLQNQDEKEDLVRKFWKILHRDPKDFSGRASQKLFSACLSPLTNEQKELFFSQIAKKYCVQEILSRNERNNWIPNSIWIKKSLTGEMNEELGDEEIISSLRNKSEVLRFTQKFIKELPHKKKELSECFKEVCLREDLEWFWDVNGGFQAMALLGDDFDKDHAAYFKRRILIDPSRKIEPVVSAIILLGRISTKNEVIEEISSILLVIFGRFGAQFSHILDVIVQNIHPSRLIYALMNLTGADDEFEYPISLTFAIAYIAEYAVIISKEEVLFDTGKKRFSFSRNHLTSDQNDYIEEIQEFFYPPICNYTYFLKRRLRVHEMSPKIFRSLPTKKKQEIVKNCFLDGKEAKETAVWLQKNDLLKRDFADILEEIAESHQGKFDNWARDGGWCAITKMGKYFNKGFSEFLLLRGQLWPANIPEITEELKTLKKDLENLGKENFYDNEVNIARKYHKECLTGLEEEQFISRRKYFMEKFPPQKSELNRTATI